MHKKILSICQRLRKLQKAQNEDKMNDGL